MTLSVMSTSRISVSVISVCGDVTVGDENVQSVSDVGVRRCRSR